MTDREKAIVMAYTGTTMLTGEKFSIFHKYIEDILGRSVWTYELADKSVWEEIKEKSKSDFLELCKNELDDKVTTLVTLSDGWDHVREAYYDKGRQLVFTECISVKDLDSRDIHINERKELSDSEVKPNCIRCNHFGDCDGCEKEKEE